jgi:hypothetical protein
MQVSEAEDAAEKLEDFSEMQEKHASGAEAPMDSIGSFAGDKSPAYRPNEPFPQPIELPWTGVGASSGLVHCPRGRNRLLIRFMEPIRGFWRRGRGRR